MFKKFFSYKNIMWILNILLLIVIFLVGRRKYANAGCPVRPTRICVQVLGGAVQCASLGSWTGWSIAGDFDFIRAKLE